MLQRFRLIEEIGRFSTLTQKAEPLTKLSLIFARNGYGKSTLCAILRSAADGTANHITARRRLGAVKDSHVDSLWSSGRTIAYRAGKWNHHPGKIYIFDSEYISGNLHIGDSVTRDNKRRLLPVVLGDKGVDLANKVIRLDSEQRDSSEEMKQQARIILTRCRGLVEKDVSNFCSASVPPDLATKIQSATRRVDLAKQAAVVKLKKCPPPLPTDGLSDAIPLLKETLEDVSENASQLVKKHLDAHRLGDRAHAWLEYGTAHASEDLCPYCGQGTEDIPLVMAYRTYFSEAFSAIKKRIDKLWEILSNLSSEKLTDLISANDAQFEYWAKLCEFQKTPTLSPTEISAISEALNRLKILAEEKQRNPLENVISSTDVESISEAINHLRNYNSLVMSTSIIIDEAKANTSEGDFTQAESILLKWLAMDEKASDPVKSAVAAYLAAEKRSKEIQVEKASAQQTLKDYTNTTMAMRQNTVNELLLDFGASFRIVDAKTNFVGREPNTEFAIEIGTHKIKAGDKSDIEPSFKTLLSAGDKATLALAFFIAQIEADPDLHNSIVIFDDPFNSQDMDRQFQTTSHIRSVCSKASQTIVLSHDPRFLNLIEKNAENDITRTFQLLCDDSGEGVLREWSSASEIKPLYLQQWEMIREYATQQKLLKGQTLNSVHQAIRPFMEDYLRLRFPSRFPIQAQIYEMANTIRDAGSSDPFAAFVADLFALNEYTRPNMHGGGSVPIEGELRVHCRKVFAIVGSY